LNLILGAGPAGLTAAYEFDRLGLPATVLERDSVVGGLARTVDYNGYLFDIGGHRFYTVVPLIEKIWRETLGEDFLTRPRLSRIYFKRRFYHYPLEPLNVVFNLGPAELLRVTFSYVAAHLRPVRPEDDFETWVRNRFGQRLYEMFFKTYTEKVWGMSCKEIRAEWAAQRIRGLSFLSILQNALWKPTGARSLIKSFQYPRRGPGMMWEKMRDRLVQRGHQVLTNHGVERLERRPGQHSIRVIAAGRSFEAAHVVNTLPLRDWILMLSPPAPEPVLQAARSLKYRDFLTVALMVRGRGLFPDNWIYVHDPGVKVGRIQNYTNWSPEMSPDPGVSCLGMEYFCFEGDGLWTLSDEDLELMAADELRRLGLVSSPEVVDSAVVRVPKAYPVYDGNYRQALATIQEWLKQMPSMHVAGRNGMHRYNNQDLAMLSGILAARNSAGASYDLWSLAHDESYLEESSDEVVAFWRKLEEYQPAIPERIQRP
jgi:protoporphyrinogen oxidase